MFTRACAVGLVVAVVASAGVASAKEITLEEALRLAEAEHADLKIAATDVEVASGELDQAGTIAFNPELGVEVGPTIGGPEDVIEYEVSLSQTFELCGKRAKRSAAARARRNAAAFRLEGARHILAARVRRAFYLAVVAKELVATAREAETVTAELKAAADERKKEGAGTQLEINVATAAQGRALSERLGAERRYREARVELAAAIGAGADADVEPAGGIGALGEMTIAEDAFAARSLERRQDLKALREDLAAAEADLDVARSQAIPDLSLGVVYAHEADKDVVLGALTITLPVWNRNQGGRQAASAAVRRAKLVQATTRREAERSARSAYVSYALAQEAVSAFDREVIEKLHDNLVMARESLRAGKIGLLEFNIVRRDLIDTRVAYLEALRNLIEARAALEQAAAGSVE